MADIADKRAAEKPDVGAAERRPLPRWAITLASVVCALVLWEIFGRDVNPVFGSYPSAIAVAFWELLRSGQLASALGESLQPFFVGYGLAIVIGIPLAVLPGYVHDEKLHIAKKYLIPKQLKANVLPQDMLEMSDEVILHLITNYTREAGVRTTEREIGSVIRAKAVEYAEARDKAVQAGQAATDVLKHGYTPTVTKDDLEQILGVPRYEPEALDREMTVGVAHGLAYQGSGNGGILRESSSASTLLGPMS